MISNDAFDAFATLLAAIGGATALFRINWFLGVYVLFFVPIDYIITTVFSNINIKIITNMNQNIKKYSELYGETITGVKEIRLFGLSRRYLTQTSNSLSNILSLNKKQSISFCLLQQIQLLLIELMVISIYIISGYILYRNNISISIFEVLLNSIAKNDYFICISYGTLFSKHDVTTCKLSPLSSLMV